MLPKCIVQLIKSFLPKPVTPYIPPIQIYYHSFDYVKTDDWSDTAEVKAYGDF